MPIRFEHELRRRFGAAVDILAAQGVGFAISPHPFDIVVTLVAGDEEVVPVAGTEWRLG
jgi:hypothetical protein